MIRTIPLFVLSTAILTGCAFDAAPEEATNEAPVMITAVHVDADGKETVRTAAWSRAELHQAVRERIRLAADHGVFIDPADVGLKAPEAASSINAQAGEDVAEATDAISIDSGCAGSSLWITDNGSFGDASHMICFTGSGGMAMPSDWRGVYWGGARTPNALWSGILTGQLWYVNSGCDAGCSVSFSTYELKNPLPISYSTTKFEWVTQN